VALFDHLEEDGLTSRRGRARQRESLPGSRLLGYWYNNRRPTGDHPLCPYRVRRAGTEIRVEFSLDEAQQAELDRILAAAEGESGR
jgi:hypothetical protein